MNAMMMERVERTERVARAAGNASPTMATPVVVLDEHGINLGSVEGMTLSNLIFCLTGLVSDWQKFAEARFERTGAEAEGEQYAFRHCAKWLKRTIDSANWRFPTATHSLMSR